MKKNIKIILICLVVLIILAIGGVVLMFGYLRPVMERTMEEVIPGIARPEPDVEAPVKEISPPVLDIAGEDILDVPRFPNSIRTTYSKMVDWSIYSKRDDWAATILTIDYITSASIDEVTMFYKEKLPINNWTFVEERREGRVVYFRGEKDIRTVEINITDAEYLNHTAITIITHN